MPRDPRAYLHDMLEACERIMTMTSGQSFEDYESSVVLRSAVERQFIIIGEALFVLQKIAPDIASDIPANKEIISFRHVLVHGYHTIHNDIVWDVIENDLRILAEVVARTQKALEQ